MPLTEYRPIPLPDYAELPLNEIRLRARAFYDEFRRRHTIRTQSHIDGCAWSRSGATQGDDMLDLHDAVMDDNALDHQLQDSLALGNTRGL